MQFPQNTASQAEQCLRVCVDPLVNSILKRFVKCDMMDDFRLLLLLFLYLSVLSVDDDEDCGLLYNYEIKREYNF